MMKRLLDGILLPLVHTVERVARAGVWVGGALLLGVAVLVGVDVVLRKAFAFSFASADELAGYGLAIASAWAFSYTLLHRGHIRIDFLYNVLPTWSRRVLDLLALLALAVFVALLTVRAYGVLATSIELGARANTPLGTPLWIPQILWFVAIAFFLFTTLVLIAAVSFALASRQSSLAARLAGIPDAQEEIDREIRDAEDQAKRTTAEARQ